MKDFDWQEQGALKKLVGKKYRVRRTEDNLEKILLTRKRGDVQIHGEQTLGAWIRTSRPKQTLNAVKSKVPSARLTQDGEGECIIEADVSDWENFLKAVGAKKKREISEEHKEKMVERLRQHQFAPAVESAINDPESI